MAQRGGPVNPQFVSLDEYDCLVYPGFLRRTVRAQAVTQGGCRALLLSSLGARHSLRAPLGLSVAPSCALRCHVLRQRSASLHAPPRTLRTLPPCPSHPARLPFQFHCAHPLLRVSSQLARWNEDGSCAATARMRNGKGEPFTLTLSKAEIDDDLARLNAADPTRR